MKRFSATAPISSLIATVFNAHEGEGTIEDIYRAAKELLDTDPNVLSEDAADLSVRVGALCIPTKGTEDHCSCWRDEGKSCCWCKDDGDGDDTGPCLSTSAVMTKIGARITAGLVEPVDDVDKPVDTVDAIPKVPGLTPMMIVWESEKRAVADLGEYRSIVNIVVFGGPKTMLDVRYTVFKPDDVDWPVLTHQLQFQMPPHGWSMAHAQIEPRVRESLMIAMMVDAARSPLVEIRWVDVPEGDGSASDSEVRVKGKKVGVVSAYPVSRASDGSTFWRGDVHLDRDTLRLYATSLEALRPMVQENVEAIHHWLLS